MVSRRDSLSNPEVPEEAPTGPERGVFVNRTLNLRSIKAIGYDMDYTLVHYRTEAWEEAAFHHAARVLASQGLPTADLVFDPSAVTIGLAFDTELGNLVKATRFGYVIRAHHGTRPLAYDELRESYAATIVDLSEARFQFMNTLFSLSQASLYAQLVDRYDAGAVAEVFSYGQLFNVVTAALDLSHTEGALKAQILADPDRFVEPDPQVALTLYDQRQAGKTLLLVTNSEWSYTHPMMTHAIDPFLPTGSTWRDLFDLVIVEARKPAFFSGRQAVYEMADPREGLLRPHRRLLETGKVYVGGDAALVEASLGLSGAEFLYVGDHLFGDVHVSKDLLRWRTALILRELEAELMAKAAFEAREAKLTRLMEAKTDADRALASLRLRRLRADQKYGPTARSGPDGSELTAAIRAAAARTAQLDNAIGPLAREASQLGNPTWGPLMRAGSDKSLFARQVERYADVYTSRVANFLAETPFAYLRAARTSLPHDDA